MLNEALKKVIAGGVLTETESAGMVEAIAGGENPASHYSGGAVVGFSTRVNTLKDCRRNPAMEFDYFNDASLNVLFDHDDSSPEHPLTQAAGSAKWYSPYHGKAASAGSTVSSIALSLNWSREIWDLSGSVPVLKWTQPE